ncbi:hypothetical protein LMJF_26_1780 [Leishmania major strain Friedlin]|uniref:Uncharacterized protein n=1 Tax=Leishmania major TaxID=5664 RepID=Q4Q914_LEIMA|nr:hypothetical protein LMJF_26_1780 [Leishmania major strain Friedlin]CAG9576502.1 hypothetical_protein_-_conserved [Leishmania major strain Friedlin]CAJ05425.1 hypothetical protein LMJF_26_1780 [Leishmania major strain Friedlin]|eukprot:XP_001684184.1 hypothetical protein LMJF_26_1780 [Leishmania major strain Friedlin]
MGSTPNVVSSPEAHSHPSDTRDALQEALTNFVTDSMYDRPQDILEYMVTWARKQLLQKQGRGEAVTAQDAKVPRLSISPTGITSVIQAPVFMETAAEADPAPEAEAANRLRHLAENRQKRYRDIAQGCLDNYLISLEDSDGDLFHIDALRRKMEGTRQQAMQARGDTAAIAAQLKAIEEGEGTATQRAREQAALLHEYEQRWAHEALDKCRA